MEDYKRFSIRMISTGKYLFVAGSYHHWQTDPVFFTDYEAERLLADGLRDYCEKVRLGHEES